MTGIFKIGCIYIHRIYNILKSFLNTFKTYKHIKDINTYYINNIVYICGVNSS